MNFRCFSLVAGISTNLLPSRIHARRRRTRPHLHVEQRRRRPHHPPPTLGIKGLQRAGHRLHRVRNPRRVPRPPPPPVAVLLHAPPLRFPLRLGTIRLEPHLRPPIRHHLPPLPHDPPPRP